jgi:hypothetical protein
VAWQGKADPLLSTPLYKRNRAALKKLGLPCSLCGRKIDYTQPRSWVCGHIARHKAKAWGWPEKQINSLANLRVECRKCSTGARDGGRLKRANLQRRRYGRPLTDAHRW